MAWGPKLPLLLALCLLLNHAAAFSGGLCGPEGSSAICPGFQCCGQDGQCGISDFHCGRGCQAYFGNCNHDAHRMPSTDVMIDIQVLEPRDNGMLAAVNTTGLAGSDSGSQWGTVSMDQVFAVCEVFIEGGNHSVAVTISSGNYSLVMDMTVQAAAGCEADDEGAPLQALLLDSLGREFFMSLCDNQHSASCLVYSAGESHQHPGSTWGVSTRPELGSPPERTYKSVGVPIACGPYAYLCPFPTCCDGSSWSCSHKACGTPACQMLYTAGGRCYRACGSFEGVDYTCNTYLPCCGSDGWCVTGMQYCGSGCQGRYGYYCDAPPSPVPRPPSPAPRPPPPAPDNGGHWHATVSSGKVRVGVVVGPSVGGLFILILVVSMIVVVLKKLNPKEPDRVEVRV